MKKEIICVIILLALIVGILLYYNREKAEEEKAVKQEKKNSVEPYTNSDGLVFSISSGTNDCVPVKLSVYEDGRYELVNSYKYPEGVNDVNYILVYNEPSKSGKSSYDVVKILKNSTNTEDESYDTSVTSEYEIYTGNGEYYVTDSNNKYLEEYLDSIDVNLDVCAEKEYN